MGNNIILGSKQDITDVKELFRERRNQMQITAKKERVKFTRGFKQPKPQQQRAYKNKLVDNYNSGDILWYFKDKAKENGITFYTNQKLDMRYMRNIKKVQETMDNEFILKMYDFLFESGQTYLDMRKTHPDIIITGWANRIIADTNDWVEGNFASNDKFKNREYNKVENEQCSIGEWD